MFLGTFTFSLFESFYLLNVTLECQDFCSCSVAGHEFLTHWEI